MAEMLKWCKNCVLPNTRPNLKLNKHGICFACLNHKSKKKINWEKRRKELKRLISKIKKQNNSYDCIIPVSGGKDSTWQTKKCLDLGLKPLAVTWKTPFRSKIGSENLKNLISLGVDHVDCTINPKLEKKILLNALKDKGSTAILMHLAIFTIPKLFAVKFRIPLIVWGENSAYEYANEKNNNENSELNNKWLKKYGVFDNFKTSKYLSKNQIKLISQFINLSIYEKKDSKKIKSIFLGHYYNWDPVKINNFSKRIGFRNILKPKIGLYNFADIDDGCLIQIHHWLKWYKFGFTRLFDNLSLEIRNKRITRKKALEILRLQKFGPPRKEIKIFCDYCDISTQQFFKIVEKFRNKLIWKKNNKGKFFIKNFIF